MRPLSSPLHQGRPSTDQHPTIDRGGLSASRSTKGCLHFVLHPATRPPCSTGSRDGSPRPPATPCSIGLKVGITSPAISGDAIYYPSRASYLLTQPHSTSRWAGRASLREEAKRWSSPINGKASYYVAYYTATLAATLALARNVLNLLPRLENLSLTAYFERCVKRVEDHALRNVRGVSMGPFLPCWHPTLPLAELGHVEEVRVCGTVLTTEQALVITRAMPRLKKLEWANENPFRRSGWHDRSITDVLEILLKDAVASTGPTAQDGQAAHFPANDTVSTAPPLIVARLHPSHIRQMLDVASSTEIRLAWLDGRPFSSEQRRLLLLTSDTAIQYQQFSNPSSNSTSRVWHDMYEDNRQYWRGGIGEEPVRNWKWEVP